MGKGNVQTRPFIYTVETLFPFIAHHNNHLASYIYSYPIFHPSISNNPIHYFFFSTRRLPNSFLHYLHAVVTSLTPLTYIVRKSCWSERRFTNVQTGKDHVNCPLSKTEGSWTYVGRSAAGSCYQRLCSCYQITARP